MDDNQLGKNIQHLREINNETLEELGSIIHCAKSTVKGYENGSRKPDLQTLQLLAKHYNKPVDELIHTDLTGLENISIDLNSPSYITEFMKKILPLYGSEDAMNNLNFKKGYDLSQKLLAGFSNGEILPGNMICSILEAYATAFDDLATSETAANLIWSFFVLLTQMYDTNKLLFLQNKLLSKKLSFKDYMRLKDTEDSLILEKRISFIKDFEWIITKSLKVLKSI